jgi:hypothetical protein
MWTPDSNSSIKEVEIDGVAILLAPYTKVKVTLSIRLFLRVSFFSCPVRRATPFRADTNALGLQYAKIDRN